MYIYIYIYIYMYVYIYQAKKLIPNNIFKIKIFQLLSVSIHNVSLYKFRFESHIKIKI